MSRARWWIAGGAGGLIAVAVTAVVVLPVAVRWLAIRNLSARTGRAVSIDSVRFSLRTGRFDVEGLRLADRAVGPPLLEVEHLSVELRWGQLLRGLLVAREIDVTAPTLRIARTGPGTLNVSDLFATGGPRGGLPLVVMLERLRLTRGAVTFEDHVASPPRTVATRGITLDVAHLTTVTDSARGTARASLTVAGAPVALTADGLGLSPLRARATLTVTGLELAPFLAHGPGDTPVGPAGGRMTARVDFEHADGVSRVNGEVTVQDLALVRLGLAAPSSRSRPSP